MNQIISARHRHWLANAQFALGVVVALGGAGVILAEIVQRLS